ncbi:dicarboxylate/amino acid:cation symporter [Salinisphaera aquimarina]|uniref:Dicarboxylate/amino acid:cation symporter n=1 Tax=Salinisphaera aquimarina TaxID=2094031 RepID=A0ABV7EPZ3_9GAMM
MKTLWQHYAGASLVLKISIALVLGVVVGLVFGDQAAILAPLGELLLRLLKFLIIPIVLCTLVVGINQGELGSMGRIGRKIFGYYVLTSALAIVVGIAVATLFAPGSGMTLEGAGGFDVPANPGVANVLLSIVPDNIFTAFTQLNLLGIIFTAMVFGIALLLMRRSAEHRSAADHVLTMVEGFNEATMTIMRGILQYVPIGIFAIVAKTVGEQGTDTIFSLGRMVIVLYIALFVHAGLYMLFMLLFRVRPGAFFRHARTPIVTAFATQSSSGTLPLTLDAARRMGLARRIYGFSLPLGATVNMDGAAIRIAISAVFAANVVGTPLDLMQMIEIVVIGTLATIGTAGVPGAGIIMIATVFTQIGLPIETVALLTSIDALVGMGCTALNVTGDLVGASIIDRSERKHECPATDAAHEPA